MKRFSASLFVIGLLAAAGIAQVNKNAQFKDLNGKSYDLYTVLGEGKSVFLQVAATW